MLARDVHLLPLSREVDRAVLPFLPQPGGPPLLHAHKIVLLVPPSATAGAVATKVERSLRDVAQVERHDLPASGKGAAFPSLLQQLAWLCRRELEAGNRVHINLTSGSKLMALASGLVGMAHLRPGQGSVYHVQPAAVALSEADFVAHGHTKGIVDVEDVELLPVLLPEPVQLRAMAFLKSQQGHTAAYRDLLRFLADVPGSGYALPDASVVRVRNWNNAVTTRMVRKVVAPMQAQGLVEVFDQGRQRSVRLTERGLLYVCIAGLDVPKLSVMAVAERV